MKAKLINIVDYDIDKIQEQIMEVARQKYEEQILTTTHSTKQEITSKEDIIKAIEMNMLMFPNLTKQVILLNKSMEKYFINLICWNSVLEANYWINNLLWFF